MSLSETTTTSMKPASPPISPRLLSHLFTSLSSSHSLPRKWHLRRILRSDNPTEINGELTGTATFHPLHHNNNITQSKHREMVYTEEGEMPSNSVPGMAGLKWTKKYIWRLNSDHYVNSEDAAKETNEHFEPSAAAAAAATGGISIWFVKIKSGRERNKQDQKEVEVEEKEEEADYLFHEFDFGQLNDTTSTTDEKKKMDPPMPPLLTSSSYPETEVIYARGDHLCVKDMYYTAYSFRIVPETGEVLSWASRHVVKGPKKNQDIVNLYSIEG